LPLARICLPFQSFACVIMRFGKGVRSDFESVGREFESLRAHQISGELALMIIAAGIELPESAITDICRRQVKELFLFGSAARGEMRPDSDLDLLVDFLPGARPGLLGVSAMMRELTELLGRRVDLAVTPALKPLIRAAVLADARLIYAA
jgi:predicted nucleotidyltransferase